MVKTGTQFRILYFAYYKVTEHFTDVIQRLAHGPLAYFLGYAHLALGRVLERKHRDSLGRPARALARVGYMIKVLPDLPQRQGGAGTYGPASRT